MTAATLVLDPIFDADLPTEQYAYRQGRNAQQAVIEVEETLFRDHPEVVDADLADYFGSIPHAELMRSLARRIVDSRVLHLIKMWLECAVEDTDDKGRKTRTTEAKDSGRGVPQGSPISPLLANLYMRRFVLGWKRLGLEERLGTRIVTYADDLVILCRRGTFNPPPHSIAVLPFVNMSGDKEQEYFSEGLTEELLNSLSRINELQVAARTSSFSFQGEHPDIHWSGWRRACRFALQASRPSRPIP